MSYHHNDNHSNNQGNNSSFNKSNNTNSQMNGNDSNKHNHHHNEMNNNHSITYSVSNNPQNIPYHNNQQQIHRNVPSNLSPNVNANQNNNDDNPQIGAHRAIRMAVEAALNRSRAPSPMNIQNANDDDHKEEDMISSASIGASGAQGASGHGAQNINNNNKNNNNNTETKEDENMSLTNDDNISPFGGPMAASRFNNSNHIEQNLGVVEMHNMDHLLIQISGNKTVIVTIYGTSSTFERNLLGIMSGISKVHQNIRFVAVRCELVLSWMESLKIGVTPCLVLYRNGDFRKFIVGTTLVDDGQTPDIKVVEMRLYFQSFLHETKLQST